MVTSKPASGGVDISESSTLPPISPHVLEAVTQWLYGRERMQRRPEATAKVLILACMLHKKRIPWPTRPAVSKHLNVSMPLVDVAISQRRAEGFLNVVIETKRGHVKQRNSVITEKYIEPSEELYKIFLDAEKEERRMLRREARASGTPPAKGIVQALAFASGIAPIMGFLAHNICTCFTHFI